MHPFYLIMVPCLLPIPEPCPGQPPPSPTTGPRVSFINVNNGIENFLLSEGELALHDGSHAEAWIYQLA
jgi:hypothetical protein